LERFAFLARIVLYLIGLVDLVPFALCHELRCIRLLSFYQKYHPIHQIISFQRTELTISC